MELAAEYLRVRIRTLLDTRGHLNPRRMEEEAPGETIPLPPTLLNRFTSLFCIPSRSYNYE